jgi:hypothetical protein
MSVSGRCAHCVNYGQQLSLELLELSRHHCRGKLPNEVIGFPVAWCWYWEWLGPVCCGRGAQPPAAPGTSPPGSSCGEAPGTAKWLVTQGHVHHQRLSSSWAERPRLKMGDSAIVQSGPSVHTLVHVGVVAGCTWMVDVVVSPTSSNWLQPSLDT